MGLNGKKKQRDSHPTDLEPPSAPFLALLDEEPEKKQPQLINTNSCKKFSEGKETEGEPQIM